MRWGLFLTVIAQVLISAAVLFVLSGLVGAVVTSVRRKLDPEDRASGR
jgi:large-conductance mechanosensitive channel